jgi:hydroxyethylthiazole kinase
MSLDWRSQIAKQLDAVRAKRPLIHNITNYVVMNSTANALLALGASPVMAHAEEEVEEMVALADALVLNLGTLSPPWIAAMRRAPPAARKNRIPIVLDPVGAGATRLRTTTARRLLLDFEPNVVRANASEILALADEPSSTRGVDSRHSVEQARLTALQLARQFHITVAVTGPEDYLTDGLREGRVSNGHPLMSRVTGTGCIASALTSAFCTVEPDSFAAAVATLVVLGIAGELAARDNPRPGSFHCRLLDALDEVDATHVRTMAKFHLPAVNPDY